jgi:hypothetical protein
MKPHHLLQHSAAGGVEYFSLSSGDAVRPSTAANQLAVMVLVPHILLSHSLKETGEEEFNHTHSRPKRKREGLPLL